MFHPDTQFLIDRWAELARGATARGGIPARTGFAPEVLGARLPRTFLVRDTDPGPVLRLAGTWIESLHRRNLAGRAFLDLWCEASPPLVVPALAQSLREARPVVIVSRLGPGAVPTEVTVAPLRGDEGRPDLFLGLVSTATSLSLAQDDSPRLTARVTIGAGQPGRPDLRLVEFSAQAEAALVR